MNTSTITFLLVTLFSTGVLVADAATPEAAVVGQDSAELAAADGSELSGQALPKNEDKKETEQPLEDKPETSQGALQKLQAAGTWVKEELIPGNERERRMMALGGAVAAVIAAILHSRSTR